MDTLPFLLRYGTPRRTEPVLPGRYCEERDIWLVPSSRGEVPAIEGPSTIASIQTKTKTYAEQDDNPEISTLDMLQTKTNAELEREDQAIGTLIAMIQTKTDAGREADDAAEMLV